LIGCALALGVVAKGVSKVNAIGVASAFASALCYAFLLVFGKHLTRRYALATYLFYALMGAFIFWVVVNPPWMFVAQVGTWRLAGLLFLFAMISVLLPYIFFFMGLQRVPASRAGIVSTWEPVWITIAGWIVLGERLAPSQLLGVGLVLAAIIIIELFPSTEKRAGAIKPLPEASGIG
jgi:drug/metabolite transporter, DME family